MDDLALYGALETNDSAIKVLGNNTLRAQQRVLVKRILRKHSYPPEFQERLGLKPGLVRVGAAGPPSPLSKTPPSLHSKGQPGGFRSAGPYAFNQPKHNLAISRSQRLRIGRWPRRTFIPASPPIG